MTDRGQAGEGRPSPLPPARRRRRWGCGGGGASSRNRLWVRGWSGWEAAVVAGGGERHERSGDGRARGEEGGGCRLYAFSFSLFF
jgi:hypothetical protein